MKHPFVVAIFLCLFLGETIVAQKDSLRRKIETVIQSKNAIVGVGVWSFESNDTLTMNGDAHFPMQSVFKFHIALAVLNQLDKGAFFLEQLIPVAKGDLPPNTWSPLRDKYPNGNVKIPLGEILKFTVSQSDNNGCDILLKLLGGVDPVQRYFDSIGIRDFSIKANEEVMHKDWTVQFINWTTPKSTVALLKLFYDRKLLSDSSFEFLWNCMTETTTGTNRIKGQLPEGTMVAHKTGSSGSNEAGVTAATNDIGIITLSNGKHIAICVYVSNSKEDEATNEKIISDIAKIVWDCFLEK